MAATGIVSVEVVMKRANRKLAEKLQAVKRHRSAGSHAGQRWERGDSYLIDVGRNAVLDVRLDLEVFARRIGALEGWEQLELPPS